MGFVEFMLGKRLVEDDIRRTGNAALDLASMLGETEWAAKKRAKAWDKRFGKKWPQFIAEAIAALTVNGERWVEAGHLTLQESGDLAVPPLPANPGILRLEMIGPEPGAVVALLSDHASLQSDESEWASDPDAGAHLLAGGQFALHYLDAATRPDGRPLDLAAVANRQALIRLIEQNAERSGYWVLHSLEDRNALILNTESLV